MSQVPPVSVALALAAGFAAAAGIVDLATAPRRRRRRWAWVAALGRRVGAPAAPRDLAERIDAAGLKLRVADAMAIKAGGATAAALAAIPLAVNAPGRLGLALAPAAAAAGYLALDLILHRRRKHRQAAIAVELPDVVDLLRVALEAGLPPIRALEEVGRRHRGVLATEMARAAAEMRVGVPRAEAMRRLNRRAPVAAITTILARADRLGAPPAEALAALARDARETRARARAEAAAKAAPKIQLVVALLLVPSVMLLVAAALAPALLDAV